MKNKIKVAVIGFGHLGPWHCEKVESTGLAELVAIVEKDLTKEKVIRQKFPQVSYFSNIEDCLPHIDAGVIVTPTTTHLEFIEKLILAEKHILCEKPICNQLEDVKKIRKLLQDRPGLKFQIGHIERFHKGWEKILEDKEYFSTPLEVIITRIAPFKGRSVDVDVIHDLMIHDIDLLYYLFQELPVQVKSFGHKSKTDLWDHVLSEFQYSSGRMAYLRAGRNSHQEVRSFEFINNNGHLIIDLLNKKIIKTNSQKYKTENCIDIQDFEKCDQLYEEHLSFYQSIRNNTQTLVGLEDAYHALKIVKKVEESLV